jgi:hypothetical protein
MSEAATRFAFYKLEGVASEAIATGFTETL